MTLSPHAEDLSRDAVKAETPEERRRLEKLVETEYKEREIAEEERRQILSLLSHAPARSV